MNIKSLIISILLFSTLLVGMSSFFVGLSDEYGLSPTNLETINKTDKIIEELNNTQQELKEKRSDIEQFAYLILNGVYEIARLPLNFIDIISSIISDLSLNVIGVEIPKWVSQLIMGVITILIVFGVMEFIKGYKL